MTRLDVFVFAVTQMFARQTVVFDVIHQLKLPDRHARLQQEQAQPDPAAKDHGEDQAACLQRPIFEKRVARVGPGFALACQHRFFGLKAGHQRLPQHARVKAVEPFVIACGHRIARGGDIAVVHQQMFRPEVRIQHHRQQRIGPEAFASIALVHQLMGVVDPDGARHDADAEEDGGFLPAGQMRGLRHVP